MTTTNTNAAPDLTSNQHATVAGVERALATYERERARLLTPDGRRLYTDEEHERRETELRTTRDAAIAAAEAAASRLMREAEAALDANDRALLYLWVRHGARRVEQEQERGHTARTRPELLTLLDALREAEGRFADPAARQQVRERHAAARAFHRAVAETVRPLRIAEMTAQLRASGRYGL